ncbi:MULTISPECIES: TRAP transporter substrate-binding protein [unclassified Aureimonas]|uniref:TRAP transporter substrate-binding protein n=1 Tax=unclassified Aureimonas TaxID=2615206 RepID=UPI0006FBD402|nr:MULTISPECIES: ABC transporter substrate-binding protein [unclassified Aureimonas]KQT66196.1 ABC transporter substrate-binding protein [Aureimonas sp. Leaf427]KQT72384.1 ABC transporter substrate-binding protein [Aureimonas sp. Leaf460]
MDRRSFILKAGTAGIGAAASAGLAAPALAQPAKTTVWRLASAFPETLDTIHGGAVDLARFVSEASGGEFTIEILPQGDPAKSVLDVVAAGEAELCHTAPQDHVNRDATFALAGAVPFMLNARGLQAWLYQGGGIDKLNGFFSRQGLVYLPGGNTGTQMGGWFRREMTATQDFRGLKMRITGLGADVMRRLGVETLPIPGAGIKAALQGGSIDAAEWIGPADDEVLGLLSVAPYYYYPGWWEGSLAPAFLISKPAHEALSPVHRSLLATAARAASVEMLAKYDARNPAALRRLVEAGAELRPFPQDILNAAFDAAQAIYAELRGANAPFREIYDSLASFRNETFLYAQVAEYTFDTFMMIKQREGALTVKG